MLEIKNISKSFGDQKVLQGLNMSLEKGKIHTIVGGNGSGKTTLFNLITGFLKPDEGEITMNNESLINLSPVRINNKGVTRTFQDLRLITSLSVKENILLSFKNNPGEKLFNAFLPSVAFKKHFLAFSKKADEILKIIHLSDFANSLAGNISYGQQKLLTIGCCVANDAKLLLLDEPVAGIDKDNYKRIFNLLKDLKSIGKTIIQVEHNNQFIEELSDGIYFLHKGNTVFFENYASLQNSNLVTREYFKKSC
ncbi:MAG: ATP-binding cassette domain-containing protein [Bacteroidales bacterium]|jgi:ABC-type branched-subunit amino acid transport system ATPase component|nr:ATP-binding cassette domain-containing protein [Bacteroidales bacterium]MDX9795631.1 ATP-binding cassette domain-containing protein [Arcobacteraceae bacterium]